MTGMRPDILGCVPLPSLITVLFANSSTRCYFFAESAITGPGPAARITVMAAEITSRGSRLSPGAGAANVRPWRMVEGRYEGSDFLRVGRRPGGEGAPARRLAPGPLARVRRPRRAPHDRALRQRAGRRRDGHLHHPRGGRGVRPRRPLRPARGSTELDYPGVERGPRPRATVTEQQ